MWRKSDGQRFRIHSGSEVSTPRSQQTELECKSRLAHQPSTPSYWKGQQRTWEEDVWSSSVFNTMGGNRRLCCGAEGVLMLSRAGSYSMVDGCASVSACVGSTAHLCSDFLQCQICGEIIIIRLLVVRYPQSNNISMNRHHHHHHDESCLGLYLSQINGMGRVITGDWIKENNWVPRKTHLDSDEPVKI